MSDKPLLIAGIVESLAIVAAPLCQVLLENYSRAPHRVAQRLVRVNQAVGILLERGVSIGLDHTAPYGKYVEKQAELLNSQLTKATTERANRPAFRRFVLVVAALLLGLLGVFVVPQIDLKEKGPAENAYLAISILVQLIICSPPIFRGVRPISDLNMAKFLTRGITVGITAALSGNAMGAMLYHNGGISFISNQSLLSLIILLTCCSTLSLAMREFIK